MRENEIIKSTESSGRSTNLDTTEKKEKNGHYIIDKGLAKSEAYCSLERRRKKSRYGLKQRAAQFQMIITFVQTLSSTAGEQ